MGGMEIIVGWAASLLPIVAFLGGLVLLDSYKLVGPRSVTRSLAAGAAAAGFAFLLHGWLLARTGLDLPTFSRYPAPLIEESAKAAFLVYLIRSYRVGFLVDAAIHGFAIGTGFALVENVYYLHALSEAGPFTWVARGFGTALMHGGTTALFGIVAKAVYDRAAPPRLTAFVPGLVLAYVLHALFNHFLLPPLPSAAVLLVTFPLLIVVIFHRSEEATRAWLGAGFDTDEELLRLLSSRALAETRVGRYLQALRARFPGEAVADMFCLLRLRAELSIQAKGALIIRNGGFEVPPDPTVKAKFAEVAYLEGSIGKAGLLALDPLLPTNSRELWQRTLLGDS